ncbi:MAG: hypothetical protein ACOH10_11095 [Rhodoglobus sp.]
MQELFRYQQVRQSERLAGEQKLLTGLALYPDDKLSSLASDLIDINVGRLAERSADDRVTEYTRSVTLLEDAADLPPAIRALYDWLQFKARPIRPIDLADFVASHKELGTIDLTDVWMTFADNLLVAVYRGRASINGCIDFQLLIRICYLLRLTVDTKDGKATVKSGIDADLISAILRRPMLLPPAILRSRCSGDCHKRGAVEIPRAPVRREHTCECTCDDSCHDPSSHCMCLTTYIADLFIIKEELARFEEGEIADIENVLAGELKVRRHRSLYRTEDTRESEEETVSTEERDHQVSEKFSLQDEVKSTIESKVGVDAGVTATFKYGEIVTVTPHLNVTSDSSKSQAENIARSYAKEIVDRSVSKLQEKVRRVQVSKVISELEDRNKHSIDNAQAGALHRAGLYYWVNRVSHAQVFNYGKHMMFDAILPEPAALFKKLYEEKFRRDKVKDEPAKPTETPASIERTTYGALLSKYAIASTEQLQPPDAATAIQVAFSQNLARPDGNKTIGFSSNEFKSSEIPKGYKAVRMEFDVRANSGHPKSTGDRDEVALSVHVGDTVLIDQRLNEHHAAALNQPLPLDMATWSASGSRAMNGEEGIITVALAGFSSVAFSVSGTVSIICALKQETWERWQTRIYNEIMADYQRRLGVYNASTDQGDNLIQIKGRNPFLNREIERNEIKRHVIAILLCNYFNGIGSMTERVAPCGYPEIDFARLELDSPIIQFFEQIFEWNHVNYLFYHSMWARKCMWPELIDEDSGDSLFDKFLMAGAARVQVPIHNGMEDYFAWFLKTGQIWGASGIPPISGDDEYVSMIQELKESKQGDYADRPGLVDATKNSDVVKLTDSGFYWDFVNGVVNGLTVSNDLNRELLLDFEIYRIVKIEQANVGNPYSWNITIDRPYPGANAQNLPHAVGASFVGAPWEIVIPTKLVYLRNPNDKLPTYPLQ